jgi:hypothetical protein
MPFQFSMPAAATGNLFPVCFYFITIYIALLNACWYGEDALRCRCKSNALAILRMK